MADEFREIFNKLDSIQGQVSHLAGESRANMAAINATLAERCTTRGERLNSLTAAHNELEGRVDRLEGDKHKVIGGAVVGGAILGTIGQYALKLVGVLVK